MILSFTIAALVASSPAPPSARDSSLRRAVALLDYVAGDYARAVGPGGVVLAPDELREQTGFVAEAGKELRGAGGPEAAPLLRRIDALAARVSAKGEPARVGPEARALRDEVAQRYGVVMLPLAPPQLARGAALYQTACASCHGAGGQLPANLAALELSTRPMAFAAAAEVKQLTPQRAFSAATYGVPNTAMPAFESAFDDQARWDLAFYVLSLAHGPAGAGTETGFQLARAALVPSSYRELAVLSDETLQADLARAGLSAEAGEQVLVALRSGPWSATSGGGGRLGNARKGLAHALAEAQRGDREAARRAVLSLYLDEFETHEPSLRARDAGLVQRIERAFLDVRAALEAGAATDPRPAASQLDTLLAQADALESGSGGLVAFVAALAIALREGVEAALLIAALLALLRKAGRQSEARAVHLGAGGALAAGLATWWASGALLSASGMSRELLEGVLQLFTAALLLYGGHWLLAAASARRLIGFLSSKATRGGAVMVAGLAFASIYREMFETVIFFRGLLLESADAGSAVMGGALCGLALLVVLVALFQRLGRRLQPRPLLVTCGVLLCGLAVVLVGNGARSLQKTGTLPLTVWTGLQVPALGLYGTREGLLAQAVVLIGLVASAVVALRRKPKLGGGGDSGRSATAAA